MTLDSRLSREEHINKLIAKEKIKHYKGGSREKWEGNRRTLKKINITLPIKSPLHLKQNMYIQYIYIYNIYFYIIIIFVFPINLVRINTYSTPYNR